MEEPYKNVLQNIVTSQSFMSAKAKIGADADMALKIK